MYSESQLINEAISYLCELTDSCKYESAPYLFYMQENRTRMSIHAMQVYIIHARFSLLSLISGNISSSVLTCSQTININYTQSPGAC